jgi:hypothetical protein
MTGAQAAIADEPSDSKIDASKPDRREVLARKQAVIAKVHDLLKSSVTRLSEKLMEEFHDLDRNAESK